MRKILLFLLLISNLGFSNSSKAEWMFLSEDAVKGNKYYIRADSIKKDDSFVYAWVMSNFIKPNEFGNLSYKSYHQMSCETPIKSKMLSLRFFKGPMGEGESELMRTKLLEEKGWQYVEQGTVLAYTVNMACAVAYKDPSRLE